MKHFHNVTKQFDKENEIELSHPIDRLTGKPDVMGQASDNHDLDIEADFLFFYKKLTYKGHQNVF